MSQKKKKIIFSECPYCERKNECYKVVRKDKEDGHEYFSIHCKMLDKIGKEAAGRVNKIIK